MTIDYLPAKFLQPTRALLLSDWMTDYAFRNPNADQSQDGQPYLDGQIATDVVLPLYTYADRVARSTNWMNASGTGLDVWIQSMTGAGRLPAVGAVGYIQIGASAGGTSLQAGDTGTCNGFTYRVIFSGLYQNKSQVAIQGVDTGPQTDQAAGATFKWSSTRPGCQSTATVVLQSDGTGLSGGTNVETDAQAKQRLSYLKSNPPASGNDAEVQAIIARTGGIAVQQCFTYPGIMGPGTIGVVFTLRPAQPGANRIPNSAQLSIALQALQGELGASDSIFMCALVASPLTMVFKSVWKSNAPGWSDASPFPLYQAYGPGENNWLVTSAVTPTPTSFNIASATDTTVPQAGQSIGFLDLTNQVFQRKRILSAVSASGGYTITVDTSNGISDTSYTPIVGQLASPWSDSLDSVITPVLAYLDSVGPGEQASSFFDAGLRQKRSPASPSSWSSQIANRMLGGPPNASQPPDPNASPTPTLLSTPSIEDIEILEPTIPYLTPVGNPGVSSNLIVLGGCAVYPE